MFYCLVSELHRHATECLFIQGENAKCVGPFCPAWNIPSHSLHCPRQSRLCVSESLSLDDSTYSRVQPWLSLFTVECKATWLFQPAHGCFSRCIAFGWLRPWGVAANWIIRSANSWRESSIRCIAFSPLRPWGVAENWFIRSANSWRESSINGVNKVIIN